MGTEMTPRLFKEEWEAHKKVAEEAFKDYRDAANQLTRQMALGGIAVVWVFRETAWNVPIVLPRPLAAAATFFVLTLLIDFVHQAAGVQTFSRELDALRNSEKAALERGHGWTDGKDAIPPDLPEAPFRGMFWLRTACLVIGTMFLFFHLVFSTYPK